MTESELRAYAAAREGLHPVLSAHSAASMDFYGSGAIIADAPAVAAFTGTDHVVDALAAAAAVEAADSIAFGWVVRSGSSGWGYGSNPSLAVFALRPNTETKPTTTAMIDGAHSALGTATAALLWTLEAADLGDDWIAPDLAAGVAAVV
jgi:hypothetical protein